MRRTTKLFAALACLLLAGLPAATQAQQIDQAVQDLAGQILDSLQAEGKTKIAVIELTDLSGQVTPLGRLVAEEMISQLFTRGGTRLKLVERAKLDEVLGEQRLGVKGLLEKQNVETFGRILGVQAILTGTVAVFDDRVRINARLIAVPSAELFATASTYLSRVGLAESFFQPEKNEAAETGGGTGKAPSPGPGPVATKEFKGISYELLGCVRETRLITCHLVLINNGADREYSLHVTYNSKTFLYDQRGHQFLVSRVRLGDVEVTRNTAKKFLITEIPNEAKLYFEGVPSTIEFIKILHLSTKDGDVEFRDVHFTEQVGG